MKKLLAVTLFSALSVSVWGQETEAEPALPSGGEMEEPVGPTRLRSLGLSFIGGLLPTISLPGTGYEDVTLPDGVGTLIDLPNKRAGSFGLNYTSVKKKSGLDSSGMARISSWSLYWGGPNILAHLPGYFSHPDFMDKIQSGDTEGLSMLPGLALSYRFGWGYLMNLMEGDLQLFFGGGFNIGFGLMRNHNGIALGTVFFFHGNYMLNEGLGLYFGLTADGNLNVVDALVPILLPQFLPGIIVEGTRPFTLDISPSVGVTFRR